MNPYRRSRKLVLALLFNRRNRYELQRTFYERRGFQEGRFRLYYPQPELFLHRILWKEAYKCQRMKRTRSPRFPKILC